MPSFKRQAARGWVSAAIAILFGLLGLALAAPGFELLRLGGTPYYLASGISLCAIAFLAWTRRKAALYAYALFMVASLSWALWETGGDGWAMMPRVAGPALAGLALLGPEQPGRATAQLSARWTFGALMLAVFALPFALVTIAGERLTQASPDSAVSPLMPSITGGTGGTGGEWRNYGNDAGGSRFSPLTQIDVHNVGNLREIWRARLGTPPRAEHFVLEGTPLFDGRSLYACTGDDDVVALDPDSGAVRWRFRSKINHATVVLGVCRGVSFAETGPVGQPCASRVFIGTVDARLIALDAVNGRPCTDFGTGGTVDLRAGLGEVIPGYYYVTSPPAVAGGKIVVGAGILDNQSRDVPSGVIRAYDLRTGQLAWGWDMNRAITGPLQAGEQWSRGTPNAWAPMSADEKLGLVYVPLGNPSPDYYGSLRTSAEHRFGSSVVALDLQTGKPRWSFQTTHGDQWDYDIASQPTLVDITTATGVVPALVQPTKRGEIFVLDRRNGQPVHAVEERPVPRSEVPSATTAPTQPFSAQMPHFGVSGMTEADMWGISPIDQLWCRIAFRKARYEGPMTPVGMRPTIVAPGYFGGIDWGGVSVDPRTGVMIVNSNRMANYNRLIPRAEANRLGLKPSDPRAGGDNAGAGAQEGTPFAVSVAPFLSPIGVPCQKPPFGLLSAVDLRTGQLLWSRRFGTARKNGPLGISTGLGFTMGVPNIGGSITTGGNVAFIGASTDGYFRAIDVRDGKELWRTSLPAGGQATPMTFVSPRTRRQIVVMMAGGHHYLGTAGGDYVIAYALPEHSPRQ